MASQSAEKSVQQLLQTNEKLAKFISKITTFKKIELIVHQALSKVLFTAVNENSFNKELMAAIHVANYEQGRLKLLCDNAAISTRLRYLLPELTQRMRHEYHFSDLISIEIKIATATQTIQPPAKKVTASEENLKMLKDILAKLRT